MSRMVVEVYDAFRAANVDENLARAAAEAVVGREELATKLDLERAFGRVQTGQFDAGLKSEIGRFGAEVTSEVGRFGANLKADLRSLKGDVKLLTYGYSPVIIGLLIKLVFFP